MPRIVSVGTALPDNVFNQQDVKEQVRNMFTTKFKGTERMLSIFENSNIEKRYFCAPMEWFLTEHTFAEKNDLYIKNAVQLSKKAVENCLEKTEYKPQDIDMIIFVSSTGIATPSIDALLINELRFNNHVKRAPLWGLGCAGGVVGLTRAYEYAKAFPESKVVAIALELCGITFQNSDFTKSNFIATALFGEGAAATLVVGDNVERDITQIQPVMLETMSTLWYDTLDIMGWQLGEKGLEVIFSKDIPTFVKKYMRENIDEFLAHRNLTLEEIQHVILHPGGMKVIEAYKEVLSVSQDRVEEELQVIREHGNMSSPTVMFVLQEKLKKNVSAGDYGLISALGPGFSSESILVKWV